MNTFAAAPRCPTFLKYSKTFCKKDRIVSFRNLMPAFEMQKIKYRKFRKTIGSKRWKFEHLKGYPEQTFRFLGGLLS